jgi:hypothetical protein
LSDLILLFNFSALAKSELPAAAPAPTPAPPVTYKIKQVISAQNLVVAETSDSNEFLAPGKIFLVTFPNEKQCALSLKDKKGALLTLSSVSCAHAADITRALPLEASLVDIPLDPQPVAVKTPSETPAAAVAPVAPEPYYPSVKVDRWIPTRFSISTHYSGANDLRFSDVNITTTTGSGTGEVDYGLESSVGLGLSFASMHPQGWGYLSNIFYERARQFKSVTIKGSTGGATYVANGDAATISFFVAEMNAVYRWENFYMPFGLSVSAPLVSKEMTGVNYSGGIGFFWGGGFILSENASLEIFMRSIGMQLKEYTTTATVDYGFGNLTGLGVGFKFWF